MRGWLLSTPGARIGRRSAEATRLKRSSPRPQRCLDQGLSGDLHRRHRRRGRRGPPTVFAAVVEAHDAQARCRPRPPRRRHPRSPWPSPAWSQEALDADDPATSLRLHARNSRRICERVADLLWAVESAGRGRHGRRRVVGRPAGAAAYLHAHLRPQPGPKDRATGRRRHDHRDYVGDDPHLLPPPRPDAGWPRTASRLGWATPSSDSGCPRRPRQIRRAARGRHAIGRARSPHTPVDLSRLPTPTFAWTPRRSAYTDLPGADVRSADMADTVDVVTRGIGQSMLTQAVTECRQGAAPKLPDGLVPYDALALSVGRT